MEAGGESSGRLSAWGTRRDSRRPLTRAAGNATRRALVPPAFVLVHLSLFSFSVTSRMQLSSSCTRLAPLQILRHIDQTTAAKKRLSDALNNCADTRGCRKRGGDE